MGLHRHEQMYIYVSVSHIQIQGGFFNWLHQNLAKSRMKLDNPNFSKCQNLKLDTPNFSKCQNICKETVLTLREIRGIEF